MADARLTDKTAYAGTLNLADLVHIVDVSDTSQDPAGSSYKLMLSSIKTLFGTPTLAQVLAAGRDVDATGTIKTFSSANAIDVNSSYLYGATNITVNWTSAKLFNTSGVKSIDWASRELFFTDGTTPVLNYGTRALSGNWTIDGNFSPLTDNAYNLGTPTEGWANLYMGSKIHYTSDLEFRTAGVEKMRLTASGDLSIGFGASPTARLHVKGAGATSATTTAEFHNSTGTNNALLIRDDGHIAMGTATFGATSRLKVETTESIAIFANNVATSGDGYGGYMTSTAASSGTNYGVMGIASNGAINKAIATNANNPGASANNWSIYSESQAQSYFAGSVGIGVTTPSATLHVKGSGATSATYSMKVQNSASTESLVCRDDLSVYNLGGGSVSTNTAFGVAALTVPTATGIQNTAYGHNALTLLSNGLYNTAVGASALSTNVSGSYNTAIGKNALALSTGSENTAVGTDALRINAGGGKNTAIGGFTLYANTTGNENTALGDEALQAVVSGSGNVGLGFRAGFYETGSNKLFIDNAQRASEADGRVKALIYGVFDASVANQQLHFNAAHINVDDLPVGRASVSVGELFVDTAANVLANGDYVVARKV